jgi:hypothetical protein
MIRGKGWIAFCSRDEIGLVLSDKPEPVTYADGTTANAWTGIHLSPEKAGQPWSSRNPRFFVRIEDIEIIGKAMTKDKATFATILPR